jgi:DNA-binding transcriptional LysR family regulator
MAQLDSHHIDEVAALLTVAAEKSFVAAGRRLQRHPTIISKRIAALESRLGVRLLERTTRQIKLTDAGARLAERLRSATDLIVEAEQEASLGAAEIRGTLQLALPAAMGRLWLGPILPEFLSVHPLLSVEANYSERYVDLIAEGFDAAIRVGDLTDSLLIARKLSDHQRILCASPAYLERHGVPETPRDLASHNCLGFTRLRSFPEWRLSKAGQTEIIATRGSLTANDSETLLAAARAGTGILGAGDWLMIRDIAAGRLVRVLPDWELDAKGGVYIVRPSAKFAPAKTKAFVDWIIGKFTPGAPWDLGVAASQRDGVHTL